ncbi:MAG: Na/Pi symporter [Acidobacteria bacterium]|nr:Na/Pi symporter [Acidobacteriota bacterium]
MWIPSLEFALGGIGLLLLGMSMLTDGLKLAAGNALTGWLDRSTATRLRGLATGFALTALVQSSSAVTVATIGFVNAGLLTLSQAAWLIFGSNVGTTVTGWLVSLVGLDLNIDAWALPLVGLGTLARLFRPHDRLAAVATAVAGFGLLFLGLSFLKSGFADIGEHFAQVAFNVVGVQGVVYSLLIGAALTAVTQSSSAAIAVIISAHAQGVVGDVIGASLVIGANVGTTATALLASVGATTAAKRLALLHVIFNVQTALVAVVLLVPLLQLLATVRSTLGAGDESAVTLAIFHTVFNIVGVLLMWPLAAPVSRWVSTRFTSGEGLVGQPRYLDDSALAVPETGARAAALEMGRASSMLIAAVSGLLHGTPRERVSLQLTESEALFTRIGEFVQRLNRTTMSKDLSAAVIEVLGALVRFRSTLMMVRDWLSLKRIEDDIRMLPQPLVATLDTIFRASDAESPEFDPAASRHHASEFKAQRREHRDLLIEEAAQGKRSVDDATRVLPYLVELGELTSELSKAASALHAARTDKKVPQAPQREES